MPTSFITSTTSGWTMFSGTVKPADSARTSAWSVPREEGLSHL